MQAVSVNFINGKISYKHEYSPQLPASKLIISHIFQYPAKGKKSRIITRESGPDAKFKVDKLNT
jgi:hypothetical protein